MVERGDGERQVVLAELLACGLRLVKLRGAHRGQTAVVKGQGIVLEGGHVPRAQREERDIEALSVDELKQRIVATARRRRERRAQLQVAEAYVY